MDSINTRIVMSPCQMLPLGVGDYVGPSSPQFQQMVFANRDDGLPMFGIPKL